VTRTCRTVGLAAAGAAALALVLPGGSVGAKSRTCQVSGTTTFGPGLTMTGRGVGYGLEGAVMNCVGDGPRVRAPFGAHGFGDVLSCKGGKSLGHMFIDWPVGNGSSIVFNANATGPAMTITGHVTWGRYAGATLRATIRLIYPELRCRTSGGVTSGTFSGVLTL
jgi:hypothetical protein